MLSSVILWLTLSAAGLVAEQAINQQLCIPGVSCSLKSLPNLDTCCINDPSGHFLSTQFWDNEPALGGSKTWTVHGLWPDLCDGGFDMYCDSSRSLSAEKITAILSNASTPAIMDNTGATHPGLLEFMMKHWLSLDSRNSNLWSHEWNKHGTCISTIEPKCYRKDRSAIVEDEQLDSRDVLDYFTHAALLYTTLPTYDFFERHGIVPSFEKTYDLEHLQRAIWDSPHGMDATVKCRNHNELSEIWYSFHARGSLRDAMDLWWSGNRQWNTWVASNPLKGQDSNCPATGIRYLPKHGKGSDPSPTTTYSHTATPTATHTSVPRVSPYTGKGRLMIKVVSDERSAAHDTGQVPMQASLDQSDDLNSTSLPLPARYTGCLIRKGTWYHANALTSCATFTAHDDVKANEATTDDDDYHLFTLASRFAPCSFVQEQPDLSATGDDRTSPVGTMFFACDQDLPFQTILSNSRQHNDAAKMLTLGSQHKYQFFAEKVPSKAEQVKLWTDDGWATRKVRVEIFWEALDES